MRSQCRASPAGEDNRLLDKTLLRGLGDLLTGVSRNYPLRDPVVAAMYRGLPPGIADHVPDSYLAALGQTG